MMQMDEYLAIYMNGMTFMFFTYVSARLFSHRHRTRPQIILATTLAVWAFFQLKELIFFFPEAQSEEFINLMLFVDGWAVAFCASYLLELTAPGWMSVKRMFLLLLPFILFTVAYYMAPLPAIITGYWIFISLYCVCIITVITFAYIRYNKYIKQNYSYSENIDITWLKKATVILVICLAIWMYTSIYSSAWGYCIYYLSTISLWAFIVQHSEYQVSIPMPDNLKGNLLDQELHEEEGCPIERPGEDVYSYIFKEELAKVMNEQQLYLNPKLTINDLANAIGTNRTYLSSYFNNELNITFYDYINNLRIEKASKPLLTVYPFTMNIDEIAERSGFNSPSTFRRAFLKNTGMTPLQYRKCKHPADSF